MGAQYRPRAGWEPTVKRVLVCRHCGDTRTVRGPAEEVARYIDTCGPCFDDAQQRRFDRMMAERGAAWAIEHFGPV